MDPNNNQQAPNASVSGQPGVNNAPINMKQQQNWNPTPVDMKKKPSNKKALFAVLGGVLVVAIVVAVIVLLPKNGKTDEVKQINFEEDNKLDMYSVRAAETNPTEYVLDEDILNETEEKAVEYLDAADMDVDAMLNYFKSMISKELNKNNTDEALRLLWREHDLLQRRGLNELALQVLLGMDESKLVKFQKVYLYRAIVTAAVMVDNQEVVDKYSAFVQELDPPQTRADIIVEESVEHEIED